MISLIPVETGHASGGDSEAIYLFQGLSADKRTSSCKDAAKVSLHCSGKFRSAAVHMAQNEVTSATGAARERATQAEEPKPLRITAHALALAFSLLFQWPNQACSGYEPRTNWSTAYVPNSQSSKRRSAPSRSSRKRSLRI